MQTSNICKFYRQFFFRLFIIVFVTKLITFINTSIKKINTGKYVGAELGKSQIKLNSCFVLDNAKLEVVLASHLTQLVGGGWVRNLTKLMPNKHQT